MSAGGEAWTEDSKEVWLCRSSGEAFKEQLFSTKLDRNDYYGAARQIEEVAYPFEHSSPFKGNKGSTNSVNFISNEVKPPLPMMDSDGDVIMSKLESGHQQNRNQAGKRT